MTEQELLLRLERLEARGEIENLMARYQHYYTLRNSQAILDELAGIAPVHVVRGNNDKEWAEAIPHALTFTLDGMTFYMIHNKKEVPADLSGVDVVVFGHSHKYLQKEKDGILWLNPGSCGPRRFHQEITMMMAEIADGHIQVTKITIPHEVK